MLELKGSIENANSFNVRPMDSNLLITIGCGHSTLVVRARPEVALKRGNRSF